jgi:hypothetical protein
VVEVEVAILPVPVKTVVPVVEAAAETMVVLALLDKVITAVIQSMMLKVHPEVAEVQAQSVEMPLVAVLALALEMVALVQHQASQELLSQGLAVVAAAQTQETLGQLLALAVLVVVALALSLLSVGMEPQTQAVVVAAADMTM